VHSWWLVLCGFYRLGVLVWLGRVALVAGIAIGSFATLVGVVVAAQLVAVVVVVVVVATEPCWCRYLALVETACQRFWSQFATIPAGESAPVLVVLVESRRAVAILVQRVALY
jgi:hypothetical protein